MVMENLGAALKWLRERRGWVQKELAANAKVSKGMVCSWERGNSEPTIESLNKVLRALGADLCDLFCALQIVHGRPAEVHGLSPHFLPGQARPPRGRGNKPLDAQPGATPASSPAGLTTDDPRSREDVMRVLAGFRAFKRLIRD